MPGKAKSNTLKHKEDVEEKEKWMKVAIKRYQEEFEFESHQRKGVRTIIADVESQCYRKTKHHVHLDRSTVIRRANGGRSLAEFNKEKSWLNRDETKLVVAYAIELARRGFPLSHRRLREHVSDICSARHGDKFTELGKKWSQRFIEDNRKDLHMCWSHPLDHSRARAGNPATKAKYYTLLEEVIMGEEGEEPVAVELIFGVDETGIQSGIGTRERVIGVAGERIQHQQRSGNRENITVIVTICADGTSLAPAVIFKGEHYQVSWKQDNPLNAS